MDIHYFHYQTLLSSSHDESSVGVSREAQLLMQSQFIKL